MEEATAGNATEELRAEQQQLEKKRDLERKVMKTAIQNEDNRSQSDSPRD